jgi:hypothetical protein
MYEDNYMITSRDTYVELLARSTLLLVLGAKSLDTCVVDGGAVHGGHDGIQ